MTARVCETSRSRRSRASVPVRALSRYTADVLADLRRLSRTAFARKYRCSIFVASRAAKRYGLPRRSRPGLCYEGPVLVDLRRLPRGEFARKYGVSAARASQAARYHGLPVQRLRPRGFWRGRKIRRDLRRLTRRAFARRYRISAVYASSIGARLGVRSRRAPRPLWEPSARVRPLIGYARDRVVARAAGVSAQTVFKYRVRHGIRTAGGIEVSRWLMTRVWGQHRKGWSVARIAKDLWVSRDMVRRVLAVRRVYLRAHVALPA